MKNELTQAATVENNPRPRMAKPQLSRRERRAHINNLFPKNNNGTLKNSRSRQLMTVWNDQAIYFPRRKKLKGYQKNNH